MLKPFGCYYHTSHKQWCPPPLDAQLPEALLYLLGPPKHLLITGHPFCHSPIHSRVSTVWPKPPSEAHIPTGLPLSPTKPTLSSALQLRLWYPCLCSDPNQEAQASQLSLPFLMPVSSLSMPPSKLFFSLFPFLGAHCHHLNSGLQGLSLGFLPLPCSIASISDQTLRVPPGRGV